MAKVGEGSHSTDALLGRNHYPPSPLPPPSRASEKTGKEGPLLSTFMFLSRCPNILVPRREKTPSPCPRRQAASPSAGGKEGRLSLGDPGETTRTSIERSILARHFASRGKRQGGAEL